MAFIRSVIGFMVCTFFLATAVVAQTTTDTTKVNINDSTTVINNAIQAPATIAKTDSPKVKKHKFEPIPKKAGLLSAIVPGSGQIYNRQYWKAPLVFAAAGTAVYLFSYNYDKYITYRKAYFGRLTNGGYSTADETEDIKRYTTDNLKTLQDEYRKYLDMTVLFSAVGYAAQVIDAIASAHLRNFDMSRDISMRFKPVVDPNYIGMGLAVNFK